MVRFRYLPCHFGQAQIAKAIRRSLSGLYSGIFVLYLQHHGSKKDANKGSDIIFYALCLLYILSVTTIVLDLTILLFPEVSRDDYLA